MDLAEGYDVRAYIMTQNSEVALFCSDCDEEDEISREETGFHPKDLIEEYEDSIHLVLDFYCDVCGKHQSHEKGEAKYA